jgi:hypothetical protein
MAEFGPYWLNVQSSSVQVAEEFALVHVLRATPFPLLESFYCPKTEVFDKDWQIAFSRVLETLNDRYGLLRSLGLKPELWLDREKPSEYGDEVENLKNMKLVLSTNNLQELLVLKNRVSANQGLEDLANLLSIEMAYHQAFDNLKGSAKKWGGFESFFDFRNSEVGHHLLGLALEEIDVEQYIGEEDVSQLNHPLDEYTVQQRMRDLVEDQPELFDPVMAYFFLEALGRQRSLFGPDGILEESEFRELISDTTEYSSLSDEALVILLEKKPRN